MLRNESRFQEEGNTSDLKFCDPFESVECFYKK